MAVFASPHFDDHELVAFHADQASGLRAIVALHNTALGPGLGGLRMWPYADETAALDDVLRLSRGMTYKAALAGLSFGGGKAVIIGDPRTGKSEALLRAMGRFVDSLGGRYHTAEDVGTTVADMDVLGAETVFAHGVSNGSGNPSPATAYGVYVGIRAAVRYRLGRDDLAGVVVAVQGLGNVGFRLAELLADAGARLLVADVDASAPSRRWGPKPWRRNASTPSSPTSSRHVPWVRLSTMTACPNSAPASSPARPTTNSPRTAMAPP